MGKPHKSSYGHWLRLSALLAFLGILPFIASCVREAQAPLRIASNPWPGYEPLYVARDLGYLESGRVSILELPSSDIVLESFHSRSADMATLTLAEALELMGNGLRLRILFVMDSSNGADAVMAGPQMKTLKDLKGKRIATTNVPLAACRT